MKNSNYTLNISSYRLVKRGLNQNSSYTLNIKPDDVFKAKFSGKMNDVIHSALHLWNEALHV